MLEFSILQNTPWPGNWSEGATKIQPGSCQLFLFDQSDEPTQLDRLADLSVTSMMDASLKLASKNIWKEIERTLLRGHPTPTESTAKSAGESLSPTLKQYPRPSTSAYLSTSTKSLKGISTAAAPPSRNFGTFPDLPPTRPSTRSSRTSMELFSTHESWDHEVLCAQLRNLESSQGGLSVHWPPGQRITMTSRAAVRHRYET